MTVRNRTLPPVAPAAPRYKFRPAPVRLGYVPLTDAAPLIVAQELGLFARHGVHVRLSRELGWATVRDKLVHGDLDGAHALSTLPVILAHGLGCVRTDVVAGIVLNLHGNAITLSNELLRVGVRDAGTMRSYLGANRGRRSLTIGTVSLHSTHTFLLKSWFQRAGAVLDQDVRFVVVPPPQLVPNLAAGHLDGFCAGEPWNSHAVVEGLAWIAATSSDLVPYHPEKVLVARTDFASVRHDEHVRLLAALLEACELCDDAANHEAFSELLGQPCYLNLPATTIRRAFSGRFDAGHGGQLGTGDLVIFHRDDANSPSSDKIGWIARHLLEGVGPKPFTFAQLSQIFRADLYAEARERFSNTQIHGTENSACLIAT